MNLFNIFITFFKISPLVFGGGYVVIPLIESEIVKNKKWITEEQSVDIFAAAGSMPGAVAFNIAVLVGYNLAGIKGALGALLGLLIPNCVIVIAILYFFTNMSDNKYFLEALQGLKPAIVGIIAAAGFKVARIAVTDVITLSVFLVAYIILVFINVNPIILIIVGIVLGIILKNLYINKK
jgi:chromate transporter